MKSRYVWNVQLVLILMKRVNVYGQYHRVYLQGLMTQDVGNYNWAHVDNVHFVIGWEILAYA